VQGTNTGRGLFPSGASASDSKAFDPMSLKEAIQLTGKADIDQVTNSYEPLGPDKGPIKQGTNSSSFSVASLKSVQVLSKFWGNESDAENATDSTLEPDTDSEKIDFMDLHPVAQKYLEAGKLSKGAKKDRKHKSPKNMNTATSDRVLTRSKKTSQTDPAT
jgi:hypothetical protein